MDKEQLEQMKSLFEENSYEISALKEAVRSQIIELQELQSQALNNSGALMHIATEFGRAIEFLDEAESIRDSARNLDIDW